MKGLLVCASDGRDAASHLEVVNAGWRAVKEWRFLAERGERIGAGTDAATAGSLYYPVEPDSFDIVVVDPKLRLLPSRWTMALLAYLGSLVREGGKVILPTRRLGPKHDRLDGKSVNAELQGALKPGWSWPGSGAIKLVRERRPKPVRSVFSWQIAHARTTVGLLACAAQPAEIPDIAPSDRSLELDPALRDALLQLEYFVGGMAYKAPALDRILAKLRRPSWCGRHVDLGAGIGALSAELLWSAKSEIRESIAVDYNETYLRVGKELTKTTQFPGGEELVHVKSPIEDYAFQAPCALVTLIGSLLYVPRKMRGAVIARAFEALESGGLLAVHENIRHPSYKRDFQLMFEPEELDKILYDYGEVRYFSAITGAELAAHEVGRKTVFRVVQKQKT